MRTTIDYPEVDRLARELADYTGESIPEAVTRALREQLARKKRERKQTGPLAEKLLQIGQECASLPVLDERAPEEILGYNDQGLLDNGD